MKHWLVLLISGLAAGLAQSADRNTCAALGIAVGQEVVNTYGSADSLSIHRFDLCKASYSQADRSQKESIEAGFKALTGKAARDASEVTVAQSQECQGQFGLEQSAKLTATSSRRWTEEGRRVMQACFNSNNSVFLEAVNYAGSTVEFTVRNSTDREVEVRGWKAKSEDLVSSCDVSNHRSGMLGGKYIGINKTVSLTCALKANADAKLSDQKLYGGGIINLDVPDTTLGGFPVPEMLRPPMTDKVRALDAAAISAKQQALALQAQLDSLNKSVADAQAMTETVRAKAQEMQTTMAQRTHILDVCAGIPMQPTRQLHRGVPCVADWGSLAHAVAARTCGKENYDAIAIANEQGPRAIWAFICKVPI